LAHLVLTPILPHVGKAETLLISPDADLWLVPWAALPLPDGSYVVEHYSLCLPVSGREIPQTPNEQAQTTAKPLLLADPDFDLSAKQARAVARSLIGPAAAGTQEATRGVPALRLGSVPRLPGTASEAEAITPRLRAWSGTAPRVYTGEQALEAVVKLARSPRALVLSTHGFFLPDQKRPAASSNQPADAEDPGRAQIASPWENPLLRCGLLLAGCNNPPKDGETGDDGVLTGLEIVGTDLRGTELVVLSACETGLGEVRNGEGVAGLRQAFQLAGAEAVVATLWQIPDQQSAQLMIRFFDELAAKKDKATALAEAQRAIIKERRAKRGAAHPFYWAAFALTGR
jgi:CHAT domain-containing protein